MPLRLKSEGFTLVELAIVIVIVGILATVAINLTLRVTEKGRIKAIESDLSIAYKASVAFHSDYPEDDVDIPDLKGYGYVESPGVSLSIADGAADSLEIRATHPSVSGIYVVDFTGRIYKQ